MIPLEDWWVFTVTGCDWIVYILCLLYECALKNDVNIYIYMVYIYIYIYIQVIYSTCLYIILIDEVHVYDISICVPLVFQ